MLRRLISPLIGLLLIAAVVGVLLAVLWALWYSGLLSDPTLIADATEELLENIRLCLGRECALLDLRLPRELIDLVFMLLAILTLLPFLVLSLILIIVVERKAVGRLQDRLGPNRVGPYGFFQTIADTIKLITKEDITPRKAHRLVFNLAPILVVVPTILVLAVIPFGQGMYAVDLNIGILYIAAISGGTTIPILMAGWASRNKYALLGAMRAVAQLIAYEIPQVLSVVGVLLLAGSLSLVTISERQQSLWYVVLQPVGFLIFLLSSMAELERKPFDIPEAESEIVAGYHIEYSGMKFAMFYLVIFFNPFLVSMIATALFLGGWEGPLLPGYIWFLLKSMLVLLIIMWLSATVPRLRVDQLMGFAWKALVPLALVNLLLTGLLQAIAKDGRLPLIPDQALLFLGANALMLIGTSLGYLLYARRGRTQAHPQVAAS